MKEEKVNKLEKILKDKYKQLSCHCLCGHFESCSNCDGTNTQQKKFIKEIANILEIKLYD